MNRTYSITDSLFGDGYLVHANQIVSETSISVSAKAATIDEAYAKANAGLDEAIAKMAAAE